MRITGTSLRPPSSEADGDLGGRATRTGHHSLPRRPRSGRWGRSHGRAPARGACCLLAAPCRARRHPPWALPDGPEGTQWLLERQRRSPGPAPPALPSIPRPRRGLGPHSLTRDRRPPPAPWGCLTRMEGAFHIACAGLPPGISRFLAVIHRQVLQSWFSSAPGVCDGKSATPGAIRRVGKEKRLKLG